MLTNNLSDFTKLEEVFSTEEKDLSRNGHYGKFYHNLESLAKCPRCQNLSELVEDGLRCAIAQGELTTALEILEVAGHLDQDAIDALNLYRGVVSHA